MFDVGESLRAGLTRAESELRGAQRSVTLANTRPDGRDAGAAMAKAARAALFDEALLGALHARLQELKAVAK
ncbi:MAG TPA: hypothetical protein VIJ64_04890 [Candidatus Lustribacter sp.]